MRNLGLEEVLEGAFGEEDIGYCCDEGEAVEQTEHSWLRLVSRSMSERRRGLYRWLDVESVKLKKMGSEFAVPVPVELKDCHLLTSGRNDM